MGEPASSAQVTVIQLALSALIVMTFGFLVARLADVDSRVQNIQHRLPTTTTQVHR